MSKFRKRFAVATAIVLTLALLAGCGGKKETEAPKPAVAEEPAKPVKIQFWTISLKPKFEEYINGRIQKFQNENKNVTVEWTDLPGNAIEEKLLAAISSGDAPDVVNLNTSGALTFAGKGALLDLKKEAPDNLAIYQDGLTQGASFKGGIYAYPWYATSTVTIYNKDIITKAGLDPAKPPKTWEEMTAWAKTIKEKTGKYAFMPNLNFNLLPQAGIPVLNEDRTKAAFNTPDMVAKLQWMQDLIKQDLIPNDTITKDYNAALDRYKAGEMAFLLTGPQFLARIETEAPNIYAVTDVAPFIVDKGNVLNTALMNVVVPKNVKAENKAAAVKFANFITNDESQLEFAKIVSILPSTKKAAADPFFASTGGKPLEDKAKKITADQMKISKDFTLGVGAKQAKINTAIINAMKDAMSGKPVKDVVNAAEKEVNDVLAQP